MTLTRFNPIHGFSANITRTMSFAKVLVGFPEDFVRLDDGRFLLSDSVLGSIWIVEPDNSIVPRDVRSLRLYPDARTVSNDARDHRERISLPVLRLDLARSVAAGGSRRNRVLLFALRSRNLWISGRNPF